MATKSKRPLTVAERNAAFDRIEEHIAAIKRLLDEHFDKIEPRLKRLEKAAARKAGA